MYTAMSPAEYAALCTQIAHLRSQLENAALSGSIEETLALSRELDALLNRLMLSRLGKLRHSHLFTPTDRHVYCARIAPPHSLRRTDARTLSLNRNA